MILNDISLTTVIGIGCVLSERMAQVCAPYASKNSDSDLKLLTTFIIYTFHYLIRYAYSFCTIERFNKVDNFFKTIT